MKRKVLALILSLSILLTMCPVAAWAVESENLTVEPENPTEAQESSTEESESLVMKSEEPVVIGSIEGKILTDFTGTIQPVGEINVAVYTKGNTDTPLAQCTTGDDGLFLLYGREGFAPGDYTVVFTSDNYLTVTKDITISSDNGYVFSDVYVKPLGLCSGTVRDEATGIGLSGVSVSVYSGDPLVASTTTNADGWYNIDKSAQLEEGKYDIVFSLDGYNSSTLTNAEFMQVAPIEDVKMSSGSGTSEVASGVCGDNLTWVLNSDGLLTISGEGRMSFNGSNPWSRYKNNIKAVDIRNGVTSIRKYAFSSCSNLTSITIPGTVTTIEIRAFSDCSSLTNVDIPSGVTTIGMEAFSGCTSLAYITISKSITSIYSSAFAGCKKLTSIIIPDGVTTIEYSTFKGCENLDSITVPAGITTIERDAFYECISLKNVYYSGTQEQWKAITIRYGNTPLNSANIHYNDADPEEIEDSGECGDGVIWTLANDTLTISYTGTGTGEISDYIEDDEGNELDVAPWHKYFTADKIKSVIIENGVTSIGNYAFCDSNAKSITVGESVRSVGRGSFECDYGSKIFFEGASPDFCYNSFGSRSIAIEIYCNTEKDRDGWKEKSGLDYENSALFWIYSEDLRKKLDVKDTWSFANSYDHFGEKENGYFIKASDYEHLLSNLSYRDKRAITKSVVLNLFNKNGNTWPHTWWEGSCYGMSTLVALIKNGILPISALSDTASCLFDIDREKAPISTDTQSMINFYHNQQYLPSITKIKDNFMRMDSQSDQISELEKVVSAAESEGKAALICFAYTLKEQNKKGERVSHAVLGYAIEYGKFNITIDDIPYEFNKRILTYDPMLRGNEQDTRENAIYYNSDVLYMYKCQSVSSTTNMSVDSKDDTAQLLCVISDPRYLNAVDYRNGDKNFDSVSKRNILYSGGSNFTIASNNSSDIISNGLFGGAKTISDSGSVIIGFATDNTDNNESATPFAISFSNTDTDYTIKSDESLSFAMAFENYYQDVYSDTSGSVNFNENGKVMLKTEQSGTNCIGITANDGYTALPWYTIEANSEKAKSLSIELTDEGVLVSGDDLNDTTIVGTNDEETKELTFSTDHDTVLVTEKSDDLVILADEDEDGTFETPITTKPSMYTITFDPNGGYGSMKNGAATKGNPYTLPACNFTAPNSNLKFDAWAIGNTNGTKVAANATYTFTDDTTVYALWTNKNVDTEDNKPSTDGGSSSGGSSGGSSSGGGGGSYSSSPSVSVSKVENGSVSLSPSKPKNGETVTITVTPDNGYELSALTVKDSSGKEISTTKKADGKYTFTMPSRKVTITPAFSKVNDNPDDESTQQPSISFTDVPSDAYYTDAVAWAVAQGITNGTTETTFSPYDSCTRAQMVTFLWRSAGSPSPANGDNPFTDVSAGTYYYDAVLWAVEHGITTGTTDTTFSPDNTVTRGQTVTFMYRNAGSPKVDTVSPFVDVASDAYYADAVVWAASNDITKGTTGTTFSPNESCTRAQIVTFLYRKEKNADS